jgi:MarR family transcriptional regulator, organic hydroperoxide resistance regulator
MPIDPIYEMALNIKAANRELEHRTADLMRPLGITAQQADAIYVIGKAEPLSLKDLGGLLIAEGGHPSRLVDRLVEAGWVARVPAPDDGRRVVVTLTRAGRELHEHIQTNRENLLDFARSLMEDVDLDATLHFFRVLLQHSDYHELIARRRALEG